MSEQLSLYGLRPDFCQNPREVSDVLLDAQRAGDPFKLAVIDRDGDMIGKQIKLNPAISDIVLIAACPSSQAVDYEALKACGFISSLMKPIRWTLMRDFLIRVWNARERSSMVTNDVLKPAIERPISSKRDNPIFDVRVLLAEDNIINQKVACLHLKKLGCRIDVAANGKEAVEMAKNLQYDIVFMDCQMPEMDGYQVIASIGTELIV
jgi:two-component system sensor histidine kinase/response regulator